MTNRFLTGVRVAVAWISCLVVSKAALGQGLGRTTGTVADRHGRWLDAAAGVGTDTGGTNLTIDVGL